MTTSYGQVLRITGEIRIKEATKSLQRLPRNMARLIREKLEIIAVDPYADHPNAKKL